jgi:hypothetical protein
VTAAPDIAGFGAAVAGATISGAAVTGAAVTRAGGSFGSPSNRSPMMFRCTCDVPAAIV